MEPLSNLAVNILKKEINMKKIEKTFWVDESNLRYIMNPEKRYCEPLLWVDDNISSKVGMTKITISFEVPEKKVTITESEFDELASKQMSLSWGELKQKLFGERND